MPQLPTSINGVRLEVAEGVGLEISNELLTALKATIKHDVSNSYVLEKVWISSARDSHICPSRHVTGNAVDLSRVNGKHLINHFGTSSDVTDIVKNLQKQFEAAPYRRENYGPHIQYKNGLPHPISDHDDHIHFSVNGDHSACYVIQNLEVSTAEENTLMSKDIERCRS